MITDKINKMFQFIDFLYSNIENFNRYNDLIKELETLRKERNILEPESKCKDIKKYDKVQAEIESKFETLQDNIVNLIKSKAKELNVCSKEHEAEYVWNDIETDIKQLKSDFDENDASVVIEYKKKYIEYRIKTHRSYFSLTIFYISLDKVLKELFSFFNDTGQNEFEPFEI